MESVQIQNPNILTFLFGGAGNALNEPKPVVSTIDGDVISQGAMDAAVKKGKGLMIGGFFVGATLSSDADFDYAYAI